MLDKLCIELPLPPSVNHLHTGNHHLTKRAKTWFGDVAWPITQARNMAGWITAESKTIVDIWVWWGDNGLHDCDNLTKALQDALKRNNIVYDDNIILPRYQDFTVDRGNPRILIEVYTREEHHGETCVEKQQGHSEVVSLGSLGRPASRRRTPLADNPRTASGGRPLGDDPTDQGRA